MPKGSEELTNARKEEIIDACAALYETVGFKDITIREIGERTSFTRTSIYNYFQTKEEIFLALLQREHESWIAELEDLIRQNARLSVEEFADRLAGTLERRECMLKLESMNLYDMEGSSRMENLVAFKKAYDGAIRALQRCLQAYFPQMTGAEAQNFLYLFLPFMFGIYPYTSVTEKQREAMRLAQVSYPSFTVYELSRTFVEKVLAPYVG